MDAALKPAQGGLFRGWRVVASAFCVLFFAYGLQFSYGVFVSGMAAELGWGRAALLNLRVCLQRVERGDRKRHR